MFSKKTYETGVVIVRCPGCQGNHLIADRLGWFGEPGSIEDYLKQQGEGNQSLSSHEHIAVAIHPEQPSASTNCCVCWLHCMQRAGSDMALLMRILVYSCVTANLA